MIDQRKKGEGGKSSGLAADEVQQLITFFLQGRSKMDFPYLNHHHRTSQGAQARGPAPLSPASSGKVVLLSLKRGVRAAFQSQRAHDERPIQTRFNPLWFACSTI